MSQYFSLSGGSNSGGVNPSTSGAIGSNSTFMSLGGGGAAQEVMADFPEYGGAASQYGPRGGSDCNTCQPAGMGGGGGYGGMGGGGDRRFESSQRFQSPMFYQDAVNRDLGAGGMYGNRQPMMSHRDMREMMDGALPSGGFTVDGTSLLGGRSGHLPASAVRLNKQIVQALQQNIKLVSKELGVGPNWMDLTPDGGAIWKYSQMILGKSIWCKVFNRIEVFAERKVGKEPIPHVASVITTTKIKLDCDLIKDLQREMPQISYCPETSKLNITMDTLPHCLAILALVCGCQRGKFTVNKLRYYKLPKKYLELTTPGHRRYQRASKYSLIRMIKQ